LNDAVHNGQFAWEVDTTSPGLRRWRALVTWTE